MYFVSDSNRIEPEGDNIYDHTSQNIATLGCALSSEAMSMTAFSDTIDPGELNTWMKSRSKFKGGYWGSSVNWNAIKIHSSGEIDFSYTRKTMKITTSTGTRIDSTQITDPSVLDPELENCHLYLVFFHKMIRLFH